jgi:HlyD family secretion protein
MHIRPITALTLLTLLLAGCGQSDDSERRAPAPAPTVSVAQVVSQPLPGGLTASGRLVPREEVAVASELGGYRVARVTVEEDAQVRRGETLALLDPALLQSQIAQARATLAQQEVAAERARDEASRVAGLDDQGVLSNEAIQQRRLAARSNDAAVAVARAQLRDLEVRRERLVIRAPTAGRVLERAVRPGDTSAAGTMMFRIARDGLVELYAEIPDAEVATVRVGDPAEVTLASGTRITGRVRLVGARVDERTGLAIARIALPVRADLRAGGFAQARFTRASAPTRLVPEAAVHFDADGASVQVVDAQNRVHRLPARTGRRAGGMVELVDGPPVGSRVVLTGGAFVLDGDRVRIAAAGRP